MGREKLERIVEATIQVSPIPLTAGSVHRIIETSIGEKVSSRTSVQRILDRWVDQGIVVSTIQTVEKNGYIKQARVYRWKQQTIVGAIGSMQVEGIGLFVKTEEK